jgi:long-chain acyl-CoA synthetase
VFTISFFASETGQMQGARLTHVNLTAGVSAVRALLPRSNGISSLNTVVSAHSLSTPFGRAVAYYAIFAESSFATLDSTQLFRAEGSKLPVPPFHFEDKLILSQTYPKLMSMISCPLPSFTSHLQQFSSSNLLT